MILKLKHSSICSEIKILKLFNVTNTAKHPVDFMFVLNNIIQ